MKQHRVLLRYRDEVYFRYPSVVVEGETPIDAIENAFKANPEAVEARYIGEVSV